MPDTTPVLRLGVSIPNPALPLLSSFLDAPHDGLVGDFSAVYGVTLDGDGRVTSLANARGGAAATPPDSAARPGFDPDALGGHGAFVMGDPRRLITALNSTPAGTFVGIGVSPVGVFGASWAQRVYLSQDGTEIWNMAGQPDGAHYPAAAVAGTPVVTALRWGDGQQSSWKNGVKLGESAMTTAPGTGSVLELGHTSDAGLWALAGARIGGWLIYDRALTDDEMVATAEGLRNRFGL